MPSGYIDQSFIDMLVERVDIVDITSRYLDLKKVGDNYMANCPFHNDKNPSLSVSQSKQIFKCFSCGQSGNVISFLMKRENISFVDAVKMLCDIANVDFPLEKKMTDEQKKIMDKKDRLYKLHIDVAKFYRERLFANEDRCQNYLKKRKMDKNIILKFGLGYCPGDTSSYEHLRGKGYTDEELIESGIFKGKEGKIYSRFYKRIMFPIFDTRGRVIAFGGRKMEEGDYKYINSPETLIYKKRNNLYGLNFARKYKAGQLILVEGYMDVIAFYKVGIAGAIASLGTALTTNQAEMIKRYKSQVYIVYDSDDAGQKATYKAIDILSGSNVEPYIISLEPSKDPDDFFEKYEVPDFNLKKLSAVNGIHFKLDYIKKDYDVREYLQKNEYLEKACKMLNSHNNPIEVEGEVKRLSEEFDISEDSLGQMINQNRSIPVKNEVYKKNKTPKPRVIERSSSSHTSTFFSLLEKNDGATNLIREIIDEDFFDEEDKIRYQNLLKKDKDKNPTMIEADKESLIKISKGFRLLYLEKELEKNSNLFKDGELEDGEKLRLAQKLLEINKEIDSLK